MQPAELTVDVIIRCPSCHSADHVIQRREVAEAHVVRCICHCRRCSESFHYSLDAMGRPIRG